MIEPNGTVVSKNIGVTFNVHDAEDHVGEDSLANGCEAFEVNANWQNDAATSDLVIAMRCFREYVAELQAEALR